MTGTVEFIIIMKIVSTLTLKIDQYLAVPKTEPDAEYQASRRDKDGSIVVNGYFRIAAAIRLGTLAPSSFRLSGRCGSATSR